MTQDSFLCEIFRDSETVVVNANELQEILRESKKNEREVSSLKTRLANMITKVEVMQLQQPLRVDLRA